MSKLMRFGGPRLPKGTHTFYIVHSEAGDMEFRADVGTEVPFDTVVNAQHYIDNGLAVLVTGKAAPAAKE